MPSVKDIVVAFVNAFDKREDLETVVALTKDDRSLDQISKTNNLTNDIRALVMVAKRQGWLYDLLKEAADERKADKVLAALRTEAAPLSTDPEDPWAAFVINGQPLVDRDPIRFAVKELDDNKVRILVVWGQPTSGKSHMVNLVSWRASFNEERLILLDLAKFWEEAPKERPRLMPRIVAESICDQLKLDYATIPPNDEQDSRWGRVFCERLQPVLSVGAPCWIVVDEFNKVPVADQTAGFVKELASRVSSVLINVRLVLLGYGELLPSNAETVVQREEVRHLDENDLKRFFAAVYRSAGRPDDAEGIASSVARVRDRLDPADAVAIRDLGAALARESRDVLRKRN